MTIDLIFAVATAVVTAIIGAITKGKAIPSYLIPIQNMIVGIIAAVIAIYFGMFDNVVMAIIVSLGMSLAAGGAYDLAKTKTNSLK